MLAALRARLGGGAAPPRAALALAGGVPPLARASLHALAGEAAGFAAVLLGRAGGVSVWVGGEWPALAPLGLAPARVILVRAAGDDAAWAAEQALRCPAVGGVVVADALPAAALRALADAASEGGGVGLLLGDAPPPDSPVASRWAVAGRAAGRLADPSWEVSLLRGRGTRPAGPWALTWRAGEGALALEA